MKSNIFVENSCSLGDPGCFVTKPLGDSSRTELYEDNSTKMYTIDGIHKPFKLRDTRQAQFS